MVWTRLQSNLRFALRKESDHIRSEIPINSVERVGNWLSWIVYEFRFAFQKIAFDPRYVTVYFTTIAMFMTALLFYPTDTWKITTDCCEWIVNHINWSYVRFALWIISEITIFGLGIRAFGRFSNQKLMEFHGIAS